MEILTVPDRQQMDVQRGYLMRAVSQTHAQAVYAANQADKDPEKQQVIITKTVQDLRPIQFSCGTQG